MTPRKSNRLKFYLQVGLIVLVTAGNSCEEGCSFVKDRLTQDKEEVVFCGVSPNVGQPGFLAYTASGVAGFFPRPSVVGDPVDGAALNQWANPQEPPIFQEDPFNEGEIAQNGPLEIPRRLLLVGGRIAQMFNASAGAVEARIELTGFGNRVSVSHDNSYAAVSISGASGAPDGVDIIDLTTMAVTDTVPLSPECNPIGVSFIPGTNDFAVSCRTENAIRFFSVSNGRGEQTQELTDCEGAREVEFTADGERGLFTCTDSIWVYDVRSNSIAQRISGFENIFTLAVRMDGNRAYAGGEKNGGNVLAVVNLQTYDVASETDLGEAFPIDVLMGADDRRVYVVGGNSSLLKVDEDGAIESTVEIPAFPQFGIAVAVAAMDN